MSRVPVCRAVVFSTLSSSKQGLVYTQTLNGAGEWSCDCPDHMHRGSMCKHIICQRNKLLVERDRLRKVLEVFRRYNSTEVRARLVQLAEWGV